MATARGARPLPERNGSVCVRAFPVRGRQLRTSAPPQPSARITPSVLFLPDAFTGQVLRKLLTAVQFGEVVSYQQLAALAGRPRASRAVGGAMRSNPVPILVPCHRVVCSSGAVGNYTGGPAVKEWLLTHEGSLAGRLARAGGTRPARASQPAGRSRVCVVGARE